ncbi:YidC/Oxa1 family membrane protein insertase [Bacillus smithii 7_3_47FAA]|jgi:YidC/Oxa1 family membrane protein insertase|uniref:Membrane protein insertase YidC n=1 Tax=Bacillus smithii 7_3_47FAA TaxID=665952 RepID=G9QGZ3_9BACI|nr:Inner membrane protein translocase component YidCOxaA protein [Bacillus smithii]EHL79630.1 YidC/Oxa1 family membrane protein insertase [Bacillus smithii 7_3_47FAA]
MLKKYFSLLTFILFSSVLLSGCSSAQQKGHFFHDYFVEPFVKLIHAIGSFLGGNYALAIIVITLLVRIILMPLMLNTMKKQQEMKEKMDKIKPEVEKIQKRIKSAKTKEEQMKLQQEMMQLYQKHEINPFSMGCLPIVIQMPIWMALYYAIRISEDIKKADFLWFKLGHPDIPMAIIAGIMYYFQFRVSMIGVPEDQKKQMQIMGLMSPLMILFISFSTPAALPLYWAVSGLFLIGQTWLSKKFYEKQKAREGQ